MELSFPKKHKILTKNKWKEQGLIITSEEEFEEIYNRYIRSTQCEICNKPYISSQDRNMDHSHYINDKYGWFRNVICTSCNGRRADNKIRKDNKSGYKLICKRIDKRCKQGFYWSFDVELNKKRKKIKSSVNLEKLIIFRDDWIKKNNYYT